MSYPGPYRPHHSTDPRTRPHHAPLTTLCTHTPLKVSINIPSRQIFAPPPLDSPTPTRTTLPTRTTYIARLPVPGLHVPRD